ncbi:MAG: carboxypeptidase-like regulatory domain-containing protein [Acidobacteriota bacterium]
MSELNGACWLPAQGEVPCEAQIGPSDPPNTRIPGNRVLSCLRVCAGAWAILMGCAATAAPQQRADGPPLRGIISGAVTDEVGTAIVGARVTWSPDGTAGTIGVATSADGGFSLSQVPAGPYRLAVSSPGFADQVVSGVLAAGGSVRLPPIRLTLAFTATSVDVRPTVEDVAERQVKDAEQQRVLGILPNYFVVYVPDAAPLTAPQKFELSRKALLDPIDFAFTAVVAGVQQKRNSYSGFGRGTSGYAKRYAAFYASIFTRSALEQALLPALLKQDPRYFYKGTGSTPSRVGYAVVTAVIRKGDNHHWQPNYSGILGSLATGALTNFYYPAQNRRGVRLTLQNAGVGLALSAVAHLAQEFLFRGVTSHAGVPPQLPPQHTGDGSKP